MVLNHYSAIKNIPDRKLLLAKICHTDLKNFFHTSSYETLRLVDIPMCFSWYVTWSADMRQLLKLQIALGLRMLQCVTKSVSQISFFFFHFLIVKCIWKRFKLHFLLQKQWKSGGASKRSRCDFVSPENHGMHFVCTRMTSGWPKESMHMPNASYPKTYTSTQILFCCMEKNKTLEKERLHGCMEFYSSVNW